MLESALASIGLVHSVGSFIVFIVAAALLKALLSFLALAYVGITRARMLTAMRLRLIAALTSARWSFFAEQRLGGISSSVSTEIIAASDAYVASARFIATTLQMTGYIAVALLISWKVSLLGIASAALILAALRFLVVTSFRAGQKHYRRTADLSALLVDTLSNLKAIKSMNRGHEFSDLLTDKSEAARRAVSRQELARVGLVNAQDAMAVVVFGGGVYWAATFWQVPLAELVGLGILVFRIISTMTKSQSLLQVITVTEGAYWRVRDFIAKAEAAAEPDSGTVQPQLRFACALEHVSFAHGAKLILDDLSITVERGSRTVLQGVSGAGKTTLIDLIVGLHHPSAGRVTIDGRDLREVSLAAWRSMIGYVPQELTLLHGTIAENITLGDRTIGEQRIWRAIETAGADGFIRSLPHDLATDVGEMGSKLSGGQRQRIALARALVVEPRLLILDEVTSAIDPETEEDICRRIATLGRDITVLVITHRAAWTRIATALYRISEGRAVLAVMRKTPSARQRRESKPSLPAL
jgi:ATP-binding cassette subfamily C protein